MADRVLLYINPLIYWTGRFDRYDFRFFCLLAAILTYALWGEPTPDRLGWPEGLVGLFLFLAVGSAGPGVFLARYRTGKNRLFYSGGQILLLYGLSVPLIVALASYNDMALVLRDVVPFFFIMLPLFLLPSLTMKPRFAVMVRFAVLISGLVFALRALGAQQGFSSLTTFLPAFTEHSYLANAPTVLFAALLLAGAGGHRLYRSVALRSVLMALLLILPAALIFLLMFLTMQRAGLTLAGGGLLFLLGMAFVKTPRRALAPFMLFLLLVILFWPYLESIISFIIEKTATVGFNKRGEEALAVISAVSGDFGTALFGKGWGATIDSPAVGGMNVNYTHSLFTTYLLKSGLAGCLLMAVYLWSFVPMLCRILYRDPVMAVALAAPFVIDCFLYASFKSLDFGLLLLLIALWAESGQSLHHRTVCSNQKR